MNHFRKCSDVHNVDDNDVLAAVECVETGQILKNIEEECAAK